MEKKKNKLIAVDFDGTLAHYEHWTGPDDLGEPIPEMVDKIKMGMAQGDQFMIYTARVYPGDKWERALEATHSYLRIAEWCQKVFGNVLPIVCMKLPNIDEFWDDRGVQVLKNQGIFLSELLEASHANR